MNLILILPCGVGDPAELIQRFRLRGPDLGNEKRSESIRQLARTCAFRLLSRGLPESALYEARDLLIGVIENYHDRLTCGEWEEAYTSATRPAGLDFWL